MKTFYTWLDVFSAKKELPAFKADRQSLIVAAISLIAFIAACLSPALTVSLGSETIKWSGAYVLQNGILAIFSGQFGWFANFWLFMCFFGLCFGNWKGIRNFSIIALILGLHSLMIIGKRIPQNEGGVGDPYIVQSMDLGYYLWMGSFLVFLIFALKRLAKNKGIAATVEEEAK